ncbi:hypothetical protein GCM10011345_24530 [Gemmobacter megaterium]|uniref:hypothetical protein n=1 Tax=Gemmobacter megaterium TaxID=1086013 RepID=UPI000970EE56|nr:hypothetical protein [Gemmobacter megaterium]GGE17831.1 hypothetical protein GCM10011345_24530 [Gemmobacter megaterium]
MLPYDIFARTMETPKDFKDDRLDRENFLKFDQIGKSNDYVMSVASRFQLCEPSQVHEYGEATVAVKNNRYLALNGVFPDPMKRYIGFYDFYAKSALDLKLTTYTSMIKYRPEHGQTAHFQVEIYWNGLGSSRDRKECRRQMREAISDGCFGPTVSPEVIDDENLAGPIAALERRQQPVRRLFSAACMT